MDRGVLSEEAMRLLAQESGGRQCQIAVLAGYGRRETRSKGQFLLKCFTTIDIGYKLERDHGRVGSHRQRVVQEG